MPPGKPIRISGFGISHVGKVRQRNEDCIYVDPAGQFALLADGMGGHRGGKEASHMTIEIVRDFLELRLANCPPDNATRSEMIRHAFIEAATQVADRGNANLELSNMGTTLVVWVKFGNKIMVGYSGDSRAYLLRDEQLYLMTHDHCLSNEQIKHGVPRDVALSLPMGHVLVRNVGISPPSEPALFEMPLEPQDLWMLCSDGLSNKLGFAEIAALLHKEKNALPAACKILVEQAYARGGEDNISMVLLHAQIA